MSVWSMRYAVGMGYGHSCMPGQDVPYLDETNVGALLTEALTADVEAVLADETGLVGADAAVHETVSTLPFRYSILSPVYPSLSSIPA